MVFQLRSHTRFWDLVKLRFLMSHRRKNSVRDKVTGKKWIYLERNNQSNLEILEHIRAGLRCHGCVFHLLTPYGGGVEIPLAGVRLQVYFPTLSADPTTDC